MAQELKNFPSLFEVGNSDSYNQLQMNQVVQLRYQPTAKPLDGIAKDSLRVLIVDDHRDGTKILAMLVKAWGHDCRVAFDGAAGLALAADFQPDVFILDLMMPHMNGIALTTKLRQQACFKNCLIMAVTGCTDAEPRMQVEAAGADLFLVKPVSPAILQTLLSKETAYLASSQPATIVPLTLAPPMLPQPIKLKVRVRSQSRHKVSAAALSP